MFTRVIIIVDGDWKLLGVLHSKPLQELYYKGSGNATNLYIHRHRMGEKVLNSTANAQAIAIILYLPSEQAII